MLADSKRAYILSAFICCFVVVQVKNYVKYQIGALSAFTRSYGMKLQHVAPHGSMGNQCQYDEEVSTAIVDAICENTPVEDSNGTVAPENQPKITKVTIVD